MCYCNKCAELLCQTVRALQMFERSDAYWRNIFLNAPDEEWSDEPVEVDPYATTIDLSSGPIHQADILTKDEDIAERYDFNTRKLESFQIGSLKIELIDGDYEEHLIDQIEDENNYQDCLKIVSEDEHIDKEQSDSAIDTNTTANEIETVKKKRKRPKVSKIVQNVKPKTVHNEKLPCVLCNEVFLNRTVLNRHTEREHSGMIQCIRCPFTTTTRFVVSVRSIEL